MFIFSRDMDYIVNLLYYRLLYCKSRIRFGYCSGGWEWTDNGNKAEKTVQDFLDRYGAI